MSKYYVNCLDCGIKVDIEEDSSDLMHYCSRCNRLRAAEKKLEAANGELVREVERTKEAEARLRKDRNLEIDGKEAWRWSGDGGDHLESMSDEMAVLITAGDLRGAVSDAAEKELAEIKATRIGQIISDNEILKDLSEGAVLQRDEARKALAEMRRQERKATMALVHMSGKVPGDGPRAILDSINVAEAELLKEESRDKAVGIDAGKGKP